MKDFKAALRKFLPKLRDAKDKNLNEADTRMRIRLMLSEVMGYDLLEEITQEHMVQGHYVDLTVKAPMYDRQSGKFKSKIVFFIEAKSIETTLRDTHAYQAINYAATGGVNLCLLTNGIDYRLYHLTWDKAKVANVLLYSLNVLDDDLGEVAEKLKMLSRDSIKKGMIDKHIAEVTSLGENNLLRALLSERVLNAVRLELKQMTGHNIKNEAIEKNVAALFSSEMYETAKACLRKQAKRSRKSSGKEEGIAGGTEPPAPEEAEEVLESTLNEIGEGNG